ncbi:hypothetical protein PJN36_05425 [Mycobacterium kansasii]|uniref:Uncharacterized protein n=4 Tax=Mycobacterium kansasii TaxID=1768 RepID=A0A1V3WB38_MYCKA|nr:hypothetical protein [Mycobacterium kansasii]AGZ53803.1 hypothetical protein MKAN_28490 [Mycobacterium kansasii ATCC 12478]ARG54619.1 hypothetical protein B1T43_00660 [Mycobacterium kansasii]ARG60067.1 hypothetical protein B1T45_00680 [Mycobacterium kansasii]ARG67807.1 hypothetical protein B1T47_00780 [Mycobacterium kansasii]ARG77681.1 hypothetical protein B1T51_28045 [Mycobacterium kansasii]
MTSREGPSHIASENPQRLPTKRDVEIGIAAMAGVAKSNGLSVTDESLLEAASRYLADDDIDWRKVAERPADEISAGLESDVAKRCALFLMTAAIFAHGRVQLPRVEASRKVARTLGCHEGFLDDLLDIARGREFIGAMRIRAKLMSSHGTSRIQVLKGFWDNMSGYLGLSTDPVLAASYHKLGLLEPGLLGRELWAHYVRNSLRFPGEKGTTGEFIVSHDVAHVLSAYSTEPAGEILAGAFTVGYKARNPFAPLLLVLLQFQAGIKIDFRSEALTGSLDPAGYMDAFRRGLECKADLTYGSWDWRRYAEVPVAELRERLAIPPQSAPAVAGGTYQEVL